MLHRQDALKKYPANRRRTRPEAPARSASGISILGALRFELSWRYRELERQGKAGLP